jgi:hypothetical protein
MPNEAQQIAPETAPPPPTGSLSEADIVAGIEQALATEPAPETDAQEANAQPNPEPNPDGAAEGGDGEPGSAEETVEAQEADAETKEAGESEAEDTVEVPDTFDALAESLEVDAADLGQHLKVQVKVDGKTQQVPLADVVASYQLGTVHQNKNHALADERRAFDSERETFTNERQQMSQLVAALAQQAESLVAGEEQALDPRMREEDPERYLLESDRIRARREQLNGVYGGLQHVQAQQQAEAQQIQAQYVQSQAQLLAEAVPEWASDPATGQKEIATLRQWAGEQYGFTAEEVNGMFDHRTIKMVRDLHTLKALEGKAPALKKKLAPLPKVVKPGAGTDASERKRDASVTSLKRWQKSGNDRDGAAALIAAGIFD